jgi:hypothetical protein
MKQVASRIHILPLNVSLHGVTHQNIKLFMPTAVGTTNPMITNRLHRMELKLLEWETYWWASSTLSTHGAPHHTAFSKSDWSKARWDLQCMIVICCVTSEMRPPLWSSCQSSWLQIRRPGFDSRHYQKNVVGLKRAPLSLVSTTEELLDRKVTAPV